jgi:hypothetical protein
VIHTLGMIDTEGADDAADTGSSAGHGDAAIAVS